MQKTYQYEDIEQMLAEADDLLQQLDPKIIAYMEEEQRAQLEKQVQSLKKLKSEVQDKIGKEGPSPSRPYSEGMHEAILDIVKAMKALASYLSNFIKKGESHENSDVARSRISRSDYAMRVVCRPGKDDRQYGHEDGNRGNDQRG